METLPLAGNKRVVDFLSTMIASNHLHHAYCFIGADQTDTRALANTFAKILMCAKAISFAPCNACGSCAQINHADLITLDGEVAGLSIETVREWLRSLTLTSFGAGRRVGILYHAHTMPERTQNVLLKTLEEPSANTVIILTSHVTLIPTVMSRVQTLRVLPSSQGNDLNAESTRLFEMLVKKGVTNELIAALSGEEVSMTRMRTIALLESGMKLIRQQLLASAEHSSRASGMIFSSGYGMMHALDAMRVSVRALGTNADPRLVLENFYYCIFA